MAVEGTGLRESVSGFSDCDASAPVSSPLRSLGLAGPPCVTPHLRLATFLPLAGQALPRTPSWMELLLVLPLLLLRARLCLPRAVLPRHPHGVGFVGTLVLPPAGRFPRQSQVSPIGTHSPVTECGTI